ncbi:hypothetical protein OCK74_12170 [Chitinophagaceae bacterium LB-8]|uniref:Lipoprotein n=1 Tax=Paraflavisolibacter caeni TaxID=2982496 RepID=A0A9X3BIC2_9BACT|nr:hypothetical protein [Paraflavisolibacter caeni]MCU7549878.1 hypothetical protein [Paraflavisolibacter caeni]
MVQLKKLKTIKLYKLIAAIAFMAMLLYSCKNKSMLNKLYKDNSQSNVHWRYYLYDKTNFFQALNLFDSLQNKNDKNGVLNVVDTLLTNIDRDYDSIKTDSSFLLFMQYVNNSDSTKKYVDLYYNLAKYKLSNLKDSINQSDEIGSLDELREYYVRYKASVFFKEAWFYVTKYHVTEVFFRLFIDDKVFNHLFNPDKTTEYLETDMYLSIILGKSVAERITKNVIYKKIVTNDFQINDSIFFEGLQGVIDDKYIVVYSNE